MQLIERGYGVARFNYNDFDPDALDSPSGVARSPSLSHAQTEPAPEDWPMCLDFMDLHVKL